MLSATLGAKGALFIVRLWNIGVRKNKVGGKHTGDGKATHDCNLRLNRKRPREPTPERNLRLNRNPDERL